MSAERSVDEALAGLTVLDLSLDVAGQYCARLFADQGAQVTLAEPDGGHPLRRRGPFDGDGRSLAFLHLTDGKRLTPWAEAMDLLTVADVVVGAADEVAGLRARAGRSAVIVGTSAFGAGGPIAGWRGPEIVVQALSGMMNNNGIPGRPPLYGMGDRASFAAGVAAHCGAMAALLARDGLQPGLGSGEGQDVTVDVAESAAAMCFPYVLQHAYNGTDRRRGDQDIPAMQVRARGRWVCIWVYPFRFAALCRTLGLERLLADPRYADPSHRAAHWPALVGEVQQAVKDDEADDVVRRLQAAQVIASVAYRPGELLSNPHLAARGYWRAGDDGLRLGPAFRLTEAAT